MTEVLEKRIGSFSAIMAQKKITKEVSIDEVFDIVCKQAKIERSEVLTMGKRNPEIKVVYSQLCYEMRAISGYDEFGNPVCATREEILSLVGLDRSSFYHHHKMLSKWLLIKTKSGRYMYNKEVDLYFESRTAISKFMK